MQHGWTPSSPYTPYTTTPARPRLPTVRTSQHGDMLTPPPAPKMNPIALPPMTFNDISLNPLVEYATRPGIEYDVRRHPAYASTPDSRPEWVQEPATNPPTREMTVVCMALARPFVVRPSSKHADFVTVRDVLEATHNAFREAALYAAATDESWVPGFSSLFGVSHGGYRWAGLSEQCAPGTWLLHIE